MNIPPDAQEKRLAAIKAIQKKLTGKNLNYHEIFTIMDEIAHERLGDVLTTYFAAAGFKEGFTSTELYYLTKSMVETGTQLHFEGIVADKHSTGGLAGTRTSMIVVPIIAAAGFKIPKTSSRAITTPAGTADVMELLCNVTFSPAQIEHIVNKTGGCIVWGGKLGIAPADDILIRVEEPLSFESFDKIIVSIMAKKIAVGANHLILDIPWGNTMKIRHKADAELVVTKFKEIGEHFGIKIIPYINHANQPEGFGVGPYLEAVDVLRILEQDENRPLPLEEKALKISGMLLDLCFETDHSQRRGIDVAKELLRSGAALKKFQEIVHAQGGLRTVTSHTIKSHAYKVEIPHSQSGKIKQVQNYNLNAIAKVLGAPSDKFAGIYLHNRIGDIVRRQDVALTLYSSTKALIQEAEDTLDGFPIYIYS
jgi:putative thymidine phosphorylase